MDMKKHILENIVGTGKKTFAQRQCASQKVQSETCVMCTFCGVPLHRGKCFECYHTIKHYQCSLFTSLSYLLIEKI